MKIIRYKFLSCEVNHGTDENNEIEQIFLDKTLPWNEANEKIAMKEAYKGEYTVEDDGQPELEATPEERITELEEALALLLSGVTE